MFISLFSFFFFKATPTPEIYPLSLHDALPIWPPTRDELLARLAGRDGLMLMLTDRVDDELLDAAGSSSSTRSVSIRDRKSTRLNSSHPSISYAVFCLKKKKNNN